MVERSAIPPSSAMSQKKQMIIQNLKRPLPDRPARRSKNKCTCYRCSPHLYEPPTHPHDLPALVKTQGMGLHALDAWHLAKCAVRAFSGDELVRWGQIKAMSDWKSWWQEGKSPAAKRLRSFQLENVALSDLRKPAEIFNQLFFLGALPPSKLVVLWKESPGITLYGETAPAREASEVSIVYLNPQCPWHLLNPRAIFCTLLHEMIHYFLARYSCAYGQGIDCNRKCRLRNLENVGKTGHGRAWQHMASSIQAALPKLLGFRGRLGQPESFLHELGAFGFRPSDCDIDQHYVGMTTWVRRIMWTSVDDDVVRRAKIEGQLESPLWRKGRRWSIR